MHAAANRLEFAPPETPGLLRALTLAALAHVLLVAALTWGVHWKREVQIVSAEAELWAAVPVAAAPKLQEVPPEPPPPPEEPQPEPQPTPKPAPPPAPVVEPQKVDIALEQEKRRILKQKQLDLEKQQEKLLLAKQRQAEKLKVEKLKAEQAQAAKLKTDKLKADKLKQELADKAKQAQDKKQLEAQAKQLEAQRAKNLQRMTGLAGASGGPTSTGSALKSAGPSASYAGRIRARIKPNIVFTEDIAGNPTAEVEVRTAPDGTIIARKLLKSSGDKAWDDAVLKAIDKTEVLPRDTDGRVPPVLEISFRAKD
jgi:colicin import membrane protein